MTPDMTASGAEIGPELNRAYGARKVWKQLNREHIRVARCTVGRLMRREVLHEIVRGRRQRTTIPAEIGPQPADHVRRHFRASHPTSGGSL
jgi:transposase InsO family protein